MFVRVVPALLDSKASMSPAPWLQLSTDCNRDDEEILYRFEGKEGKRPQIERRYKKPVPLSRPFLIRILVAGMIGVFIWQVLPACLRSSVV